MKNKAESFKFGLIHGLVDAGEVEAWAQSLLMSGNDEAWILELCDCTGQSSKEIMSGLGKVPGEVSKKIMSSLNRELLSRKSEPFNLYSNEQLPPGFQYPKKIRAFSESGAYPYFPQIWFVDSQSEAGVLLAKTAKLLSNEHVVFAKEGDEFWCFDGRGSEKVYLVSVEHNSVFSLANFDAWLERVELEARSFDYGGI